MARPCEGVANWDTNSWTHNFISTQKFEVDDSFMQCCVWDGRFPNTLYGDSIFWPGLLSVLCILYLIYQKNYFELRDTTTKESYDVLYHFIYASFARLMVPAFLRVVGLQAFCMEQAVIESFVVVFEIESLTHLCIDRYVCAKYILNNWEFNKHHKTLYVGLCLGFATLYSMIPYFGILSNYTYDFDCATCAMDMILPKKNVATYQILCLYILKAIKPSIVMILMALSAIKLQTTFTKEMKSRSQGYFNIVVLVIAFTNLLSWSVWCNVRFTVLLDQLSMGRIQVPSVSSLEAGLFMYALSPALTTIIIIGANYHLLGGRFTCKDILLNFFPSTSSVSPKKKKESAGPATDAPNNDSPKNYKGKQDSEEKDK